MSSQCKDCGKATKGHGERCQSCAMKAVWARGDYGDPERGRKISEGLKTAHARGDWDNPETRRRQSESQKAAWTHGDYDGFSEAIKAAHARGVYGKEFQRKQSEITRARWERGDFDDPEIRRKKSEALEAARARGDWDNPETRRRQSEAAKLRFRDPGERRRHSGAMKAAHARGIFDSPEHRRKVSTAMKAAHARGDFDGVCQSPTSIELAVAAALDICGIEHISQYRPDGYSKIYDEFVSPNILIEAQGDYWHGPEHPENQRRDAEKAIWAEENGYHLVVIWEYEIKEQGAWPLVHERILSLLEAR